MGSVRWWYCFAMALTLASGVQIDVSRKVKPHNTTVTEATTTVPAMTTALPSNQTTHPPDNTTSTTSTVSPIADSNSTSTNATTERTNTTLIHAPNRRPNMRPQADGWNYYCACDLTMNLCDINCCCDIDCADAALASFKCVETTDDLNAELGGLHSCEVSNDAFCVVPVQSGRIGGGGNDVNGDIVESVYDEKKRTLFAHRWPLTYPDIGAADDIDGPTNYRYGDVLQTNSPGPLKIPSSLANGEHCTILVPIRFMVDQVVTCRRSSAAHAQHFIRLRDEMFSTQLLTTRQRPTASSQTMTAFCAGHHELVDDDDNKTNNSTLYPNCIPVLMFDCIHSISDATCRRLSNDTIAKDSEQRLDIALMRFDIVHDFQRIHNCTLYFVQDDVADETLVRRTSVHFVQLNETRQPHHAVSGNAGYIPGRPLIVSHYRPRFDNATSDEDRKQQVFDYFHVNASNPDEALLRLPHIDSEGRCWLDNNRTVFEAIEFGRDFRVQCEVPLRELLDNSERRLEGANFTMLCTRLQRVLFGFLLADVRHNYGRNESNASGGGSSFVSRLGNPANRTDRWTPLRWHDDNGATDNDDDDALDDLMSMEAADVIGTHVFDETDTDSSNSTANAVQAFRCARMVLNVRYEFGVVRLRRPNAPVASEWMVHDARIALGPRVDLLFETNDADWRVPIVLVGQFIDATSLAATLTAAYWKWTIAAILWGQFI